MKSTLAATRCQLILSEISVVWGRMASPNVAPVLAKEFVRPDYVRRARRVRVDAPQVLCLKHETRWSFTIPVACMNA